MIHMVTFNSDGLDDASEVLKLDPMIRVSILQYEHHDPQYARVWRVRKGNLPIPGLTFSRRRLMGPIAVEVSANCSHPVQG